jgi:serine phosphatase RsbU (regulator of sigma subunit)
MPRYLQRPGARRPNPIDAELATLHRCALPRLERPHDAFAAAWWSRPARSIGGDVIVTWPVDAGRLLVCLADAMGHDTPAAVVASAVRAGLLYARRGGVSSPAAVLNLLNHTVAELFERYFVTATVCLLDAAGRLTSAQAGHPPLLVRRPDGVVRPVSSPALPLGLDPEEVYAEHTTALPAGSSVVLYSDGVTDAFT